MDAMDDNVSLAAFSGMLEALSYTIHKISCEVISDFLILLNALDMYHCLLTLYF